MVDSHDALQTPQPINPKDKEALQPPQAVLGGFGGGGDLGVG